MPKEPLSVARRHILELSPKARFNALIESSNASALVRSIDPQELYRTILDVGLADAHELVQLTSPSQFRAFVDLSSWQRDHVDVRDALRWIGAIIDDDDTQRFLAKLEGLDLELLELLFRRLARVHDLAETPDVAPDGPIVETAEGQYWIELIDVDAQEAVVLRQLLTHLMARDPLGLSRFIEAIRWELPAELEETALRFRTARLADLGFPEPAEALSLFGFIPRSARPATTPPPHPYAESLVPVTEPDFVDAAFRQLDHGEREALEPEVRALVNAALVAEGAEPGDPHAVRRVSEQVRDTLCLGLEYLSSGDVSKAGDVFREHPCRRVFQCAFSLCLELKFEVDRFAREPMAKVGGEWLVLSALAPLLTALSSKRPSRPGDRPTDLPRPFRSLRQIAVARAGLALARAQNQVLIALLGGPTQAPATLGALAKDAEELSPEALLALAVASAVLEGPFLARPLSGATATELWERLFEDVNGQPRPRALARQRALDAAERALPPDLHEVAARMITESIDELARRVGLDASLLSRALFA